MSLLFHAFDIPLWATVVMLTIIVFCFLLTVRGFYVLVTATSRQTLTYLGVLLAVFSIIWLLFVITKSDVLQTICTCFGLPFGFLAGVPFLLFMNLPEPLMYFGAALLNLVAFCGIVEFAERIIVRRKRRRFYKAGIIRRDR